MGMSDEERRFNVLLERIEGQYQALSEKVMSLDAKIDRGLQDVRQEMDRGFGDLRLGIGMLAKQVREHSHRA
jgi:hypothetical protein